MAALAAIFVAAASVGQAGPVLPQATFTEGVSSSLNGSSKLSHAVGKLTGSATTIVGSSFETATTTAGAQPSFSTSVQSSGGGAPMVIAAAGLSFNFEITGPSNMKIDLLASAKGTAVASFGSYASSEIDISQIDGNGTSFGGLVGLACAITCDSPGSFSVTRSKFVVKTNTVGSVILSGRAVVNNSVGDQDASSTGKIVLSLPAKYAGVYTLYLSWTFRISGGQTQSLQDSI
jgi:hypothetical protein